MAFNETDLQLIEDVVGNFCQNRIPEEIRDQLHLKYHIKNHDILIVECRPHWQKPDTLIESSIAKIRYVRARNEWELWWQRGNMKWVRYDPLPHSKHLSALIEEIDDDPHHCFFG